MQEGVLSSSGGRSLAPCRSRPPGRCSTDLHEARSRPEGKPVYDRFDFRRIVWLPSAALVPTEHPVVLDRLRRPLRHQPAVRVGTWVQPRGRAAPCGSGSCGGTPRMLAAGNGARFGRFRIPHANDCLRLRRLSADRRSWEFPIDLVNHCATACEASVWTRQYLPTVTSGAEIRLAPRPICSFPFSNSWGGSL
jgi:hypothetical protein